MFAEAVMQKRIYIADDEKNIRNLVRAFLEKEGYAVEAFENGDLLLEAFEAKPCDLVILDIMMPGTGGFDVCVRLRERSAVPIIMLTAKDTEEDYISGLSLGGDDYFTKPFSPVKLVMRVKAMLRRADMNGAASAQPKGDQLPAFSFGDITLYPDKMTARCRAGGLNLTRTEFNLLAYLMEHRDKAVSRNELLNVIWGYDVIVESRATDDTVKRLRRKLENAGSGVAIETVWGYGFRIGAKTGDGA
jgi:DNA-binding response OmpR family regulator